MKRSAIFIVALLILIGNRSVFAQEAAVFDVVGLGIVSEEQADEPSLMEPLTRGEMADILANLMGIPNPPAEFIPGFRDVLPSDSHYNSIGYLETIGLLNGDGDGLYRPADIAGSTEAIKLMVSCLGYDIVALDNGGYPDGYLNTAASLGLLKDVDMKEEITRLDMYRLIYNGLDCELLETKIFGMDKDYQLTAGRTLRNVLSSQRNQEIVNSVGIVRATASLYMDQANPLIEEEQVEIGGILYNVGSTDAVEYFGMEVEFYAIHDFRTDTYLLTAIQATSRNRITEITATDFMDAKNGTLRYVAESGIEQVHYEDGIRLLYNGRPLTSYSDSDIRTENGSMRLIDNDGDRKAEIVCINEYHSGVIERVSNNIVYFERGEDAGGIQSIAIDMENPDVTYLLCDGEGRPTTVNELAPGQVLSIAAARDGSLYDMVVSEMKAEGVIDGWNEENGLHIGQNWYKVEHGKTVDYSVGDDVTAYLNYDSQIVKLVGRSSGKRYGYVISVAKKGIDDTKVKLLEAGTLRAEEKIDDSNPDNPVTIRILRAGNADISVYDLAERVNIDGVRYSAEDAAKILSDGTPVEYSLNSSGQLYRAVHPIKSGSGEERYYNSYEKTFGKLGGSVFATNEETSVICIPTNNVTDNRNLLAKIDMDENNQKYTISGYNVDERTGYAELVVLKAALSADAMDEINDNSQAAVVERAVRVMDEDGTERLRIDFWSDGKRMSYYAADVIPEAQAQAIRSGTVFFYVLTNADEIGKVLILQQLDKEKAWYASGTMELTMDLYGGAEFLEFNALSYEKNCFVHRLTVNTAYGGDNSEVVDINVRNSPDIYLYQRRQQKVSVIEAGELLAGDSSRQIYAHITNGIAKVIVAIE